MANKNWAVTGADGAKGAASQRDRRWTETVYDQHTSSRFAKGRPWWGELEQPAEPRDTPGFLTMLQTGDHNDPFGSTWQAPWYPDQILASSPGPNVSFFRVDLKKGRLTWNYQAMANYDKRMVEEYYTAAAKIAHQHGWSPPELHGPVPFAITAVLGDQPRSPKIPQAALAGDPWLLGQIEEPNVELQRLLANLPILAPAIQPAQVLAAPMGEADIEARIAAAVAKAMQQERNRMNGQKGAEKAREAREQRAANPLVVTGA